MSSTAWSHSRSGTASIAPTVTSDGEVLDLSTLGVAERAVELAAESGTPLGCVAVIAFVDHAEHCMMTPARVAGQARSRYC